MAVSKVSGKVIRGIGYMPQKGVDYWTKDDKAEIVNFVLGQINANDRVTSLTDTVLASDTLIEAVGNPVYVDDVSGYATYGIEDSGWYIFARIAAIDGVTATAGTTIEGAAGGIITPGADHVDVAVRFEVASVSQMVVIDWDGEHVDTFVFKSTDLAVRNLDYRVTFYVYDIDDYVTWEYKVNSDETVQGDGKAYFNLVDGEYVPAELTEGDPITLYYVMGEEVNYALTTDETFVDGKDYFTKSGEVYTLATVTPGETIPANTYYELHHTYVQTEDTEFQAGTTYYVKADAVYTEATVTPGETIPVYYVHAKCRFEGMVRNITYRFNTIIDCPVEFVLPEIEDETHGCWFEIRLRHAGAYSSTLIPPSEDIKIATEHTQAETKGMNMVDLHYSNVAGAKVWRFMNTHSNFTE